MSQPQYLPRKPVELSDLEWGYILARDLNHCARHRECAKMGETEFCSARVDCDHAQPRELGGDSSVANIRLLCSGPNRGRACEPLRKWRDPNYWDQHDKIVTGKLREIQRLVGWDWIDDIAGEVREPGHLRRTLLNTITLVPGATGIGKSVLAQSELFRFNQIVGLNFPRVRSVLWLTIDTTLRDMAAKELWEDAYRLGVIDSHPNVRIAKSFSDLLRGPNGGDVTVSAVQSLWDKENDNGPMRSEAEKLRALELFDTVIFDECDWANEQVRHISRIGRHALQFALSASPPTLQICADKDRAEQFLRRFVLIAPEAIADYKRALELDACLKLLVEPAIVGPKHDSFDYLTSGQVKTAASKMPRDHALYRGLILQAVVEADNLESKMKASHPDQYYSPHIMVRMDTIQELLAMETDLACQLKSLRDDGVLANEGWDVSSIFMGRQMSKKPPDERDLSAKRNDRWRHPFMLAKDNDGRAVKGSKRILLMCNIGARGINNWPINTVVDCTEQQSITGFIQFAWGRPIRLPPRLAEWTRSKDQDVREYVTVKVWIPEVDGHEDKIEAIEAARKFIIDMLPLIRDAGFLTWGDLIAGRRTTDNDVVIDPSNRPLTPPEKFAIQAALAQVVENTGKLMEQDVASNVARLFPQATDRIRAKCTEYGIKLIEPAFRDQETINTRLIQSVVNSPENVMDRLRPQEVYDPADLKRWVRHAPEYRGIWEIYSKRIDEGDKVAIHAVSTALQKIQISNYRPAALVYRLHGKKDEPGVLMEIAGELKGHLRECNQLPADEGLVNIAVIASAKTLFDIDDASEGGAMDHPAYHIAILGKHRRRLQAMARSRLISAGELGTALRGFCQ